MVIPGVKTLKNSKGELVSVTIDLQKNSQVIPHLLKLGILSNDALTEKVGSNASEYISPSEFFGSVKENMKKKWNLK